MKGQYYIKEKKKKKPQVSKRITAGPTVLQGLNTVLPATGGAPELSSCDKRLDKAILTARQC